MYSRTEKIKEVQKNILENIFKTQIVENECSMQTFSNIIDDIEICNLAFGDLGHKLFETIAEIDNDHPEVKYGKFLSSFNKEEFDNISGYLSLCKLANQNNLDFVISMFSKHITKSIFDAKNEIGFLKNRQNFVRLLKNPEARDSLRKIKQTRPIGFANDKKLYELWQCNIDFSRFVRFGDFYLEEIEIVNKKIDIYRSLGFNLLAKEIELSLTDYQEKSDLNYYGFQRITVTIAALSLAKLHGYKLQVVNSISSIKVPANQYDYIEGKSLWNYIPSSNEAWGGYVGLPVKLEDYDYMPLVIPLHDMEIIPDRMKEVINHLEKFPEAENKPIFDHYLIISPGPKYPRTNKESLFDVFDVFDKSGKKNSFSDPILAKKFLDNTLINEGHLTPILLGEKDGKCYFICFWES